MYEITQRTTTLTGPRRLHRLHLVGRFRHVGVGGGGGRLGRCADGDACGVRRQPWRLGCAQIAISPAADTKPFLVQPLGVFNDWGARWPARPIGTVTAMACRSPVESQWDPAVIGCARALPM